MLLARTIDVAMNPMRGRLDSEIRSCGKTGPRPDAGIHAAVFFSFYVHEDTLALRPPVAEDLDNLRTISTMKTIS